MTFDLVNPHLTDEALSDVQNERARQDARFGEQNHPDVNDPEDAALTRDRYRALADDWKTVNAYRVAHNQLAWDGILLEEVYEALAESDPTNLRAELIQVAAVAVAWVEAIDRRTATTEGATQ